MKKHTLTLSISILSLICFIFLGFFDFNTNFANAYDSGCIGSGLYSITTGQLCNTSQYGYSNYNYSNNYSYGCTSAGPYNTITGQLCSGSQYGNYNYNGSQYSSYDGSQYNSSSDFSNQQFPLGSRGAKVIAIQQILADAGFYSGNIDGIYGPQTDRAFSNYLAQYSNNNSNSYSYGCTSAGPYNTITGQFCNTSQYSYPYYNQVPTISGVNGPQSLNVNQTGNWTVMVSSINNNGNLSYSVNWGDQPFYAYSTNANNSSIVSRQQNATFTHSYAQTGTYTPVFTVTNSNGQSATTSLSVVVGGSSTSYGAPVIYSISPTYGRVDTQVTIYGTGFAYNGCTNYCGNGVTTNIVNFGGSIIQNVYSYNGTSLTFTVPSNLNTCYTGQYCSAIYSPVVPGTYPISVTNTNGISNIIYFTVSY